MEKNEIKEFIKKILRNIGIPENQITDESYLRSEIGLDSTEVVEIALTLKKEFGIDVNLKQDITLEELYDLIAS